MQELQKELYPWKVKNNKIVYKKQYINHSMRTSKSQLITSKVYCYSFLKSKTWNKELCQMTLIMIVLYFLVFGSLVRCKKAFITCKHLWDRFCCSNDDILHILKSGKTVSWPTPWLNLGKEKFWSLS